MNLFIGLTDYGFMDIQYTETSCRSESSKIKMLDIWKDLFKCFEYFY